MSSSHLLRGSLSQNDSFATTSSLPIVNNNDNFDDAAQHVSIEDVSKLSEFKMNTLFWNRAGKIIGMSLGNPFKNTPLWLLILFNVIIQVLGGYILQQHFYFTTTGRGAADPGLAGCLGGGCGTYIVQQMANSTKVNRTVLTYDNATNTYKNVTQLVYANSTLVNVQKTVPAPGDKHVVETYMGKFAWTFWIAVICVWAFSVSGDILNVLGRRRVGRILQKSLLEGNNLYRLTLDGRVDNFDQRITSDLQAMLDGFFCVLFGNTNDYLAYPLGFTLSRLGFSYYNTLVDIPDKSKGGYVVLIVWVMTLIALVAYVFPMNQISRIFFIGQMYEGDLRYTHTRAIIHCESVAFYRGEERERAHAERRFKKMYNNLWRYYLWQGGLMFLRLIVTICQPSVSYMALAVSGASDKSYANMFNKQMGDVLEYQLYLPLMLARLAFAAGATHRVGQLIEVVEELKQSQINDIPACTNNDAIELKNITARPPVFKEYTQKEDNFFRNLLFCCPPEKTKKVEEEKGCQLFNNLSLSVQRGHSVVIMGPSGCGKSSLLRVIGGLWPITSGSVTRPDKIGKDGMYFLPQRSYVFSSTLIEQITYPVSGTTEDISKIKELIKEVGLGHLTKRLESGEVFDWGSVLSTSEMQRLSFARLFYHHPNFCLMDEATSAMDLHMENKCLKKCAKMGITLISVAHRPTVIPHHESVFSYVASTRSWDMHDAREVQEAVILPSSVLEDQPTIEGSDELEEPAADKPPAGIGKMFYTRLFKSMSYCCHWKSWPTIFFIIMFFMMGGYGALQIIIFKFYGTSGIISKVIAGNAGSALADSLVQIGINVASSALLTIDAMCGCFFALMLHRSLIKHFHATYFTNKVPYLINKADKSIRCIDQRVVQDMGSMREAVSWLFGNPFSYLMYRQGFFPELISLIILMGYAYSISWGLTTFFLIVMIFAFMLQILSCIITSKAMEMRQAAEGELRAHYGRVRSYIESITFFTGQKQELIRGKSLLNFVVEARMRYVLRAALTTAPTVSMYYWLQNGDYIMAAIIGIYLNLTIPASVTYSLISFLVIIGKLVVRMVMEVGGFGMLAGNTHRVMEALETSDETLKKIKNMSKQPVVAGEEISMNGVTVVAPGRSNRPLVNNVTFSVRKGENLLIMGPSGCGKSSILRVLAGLVSASHGTCSLPRNDPVFFVPQTSYATEGTLKEQVIYPLDSSAVSDETIISVLDEVGLLYLTKRWGLHNVVLWDDVLSGGEQQRLGFARLFFHNPPFAVLDEATSALDVPLEAKMFEACERREITLLSVATRPSVMKFHSRAIQLTGGGDYEIVPLGSDHEKVISPFAKPQMTPTSSPIDTIGDSVFRL